MRGYVFHHIYLPEPSLTVVGVVLYYSSSFQAVTYAQGEALAKEFGIPFMETSAVESINVDEAFNKLTQIVYDRLESTGMLSRRPSGSFKQQGSNGAANLKQSSNVSEENKSGCCS